MHWFTLTVLIVLCLFTTYSISLIFIRKKLKDNKTEILKEFNGQKTLFLSNSANFFGLKSQGMSQVRGNGTLLVTEELLFFRMLVPTKEIQIPLKDIVKISTPRSFLGKSKFVKLLRVDFVDKGGCEDAAAWVVRELDEILECLG